MNTMRDTSPEAVAKWIRRRAFWRKVADRLIVCAFGALGSIATLTIIWLVERFILHTR